MAKTAGKKRKVIVESIGEAHVTASFNNIIISLTNTKGEVISWSSAGKMGFRGSKKNTPYAAQTAAEDCAKSAQEAGLRKVKVYVKGPGNGRESAIRTLRAVYWLAKEVTLIHSSLFKKTQLWQDILVQKQKLLENLASPFSEKTNPSKKEIILQDSMEMRDEEVKNLNMLSSSWKSKKRSLLTAS